MKKKSRSKNKRNPSKDSSSPPSSETPSSSSGPTGNTKLLSKALGVFRQNQDYTLPDGSQGTYSRNKIVVVIGKTLTWSRKAVNFTAALSLISVGFFTILIGSVSFIPKAYYLVVELIHNIPPLKELLELIHKIPQLDGFLSFSEEHQELDTINILVAIHQILLGVTTSWFGEKVWRFNTSKEQDPNEELDIEEPMILTIVVSLPMVFLEIVKKADESHYKSVAGTYDFTPPLYTAISCAAFILALTFFYKILSNHKKSKLEIED